MFAWQKAIKFNFDNVHVGKNYNKSGHFREIIFKNQSERGSFYQIVIGYYQNYYPGFHFFFHL